eukprot:c39493_g1_i1 orf=197-454(+)
MLPLCMVEPEQSGPLNRRMEPVELLIESKTRQSLDGKTLLAKSGKAQTNALRRPRLPNQVQAKEALWRGKDPTDLINLSKGACWP